MGVTVDAKQVAVGINKLINQQLPEAIEKALTESCQVVEAQTKVNAPVKDGQLQGSIRHKVEGNYGTVYTEVEYAPYVEVGTGIYALNGDGRKDVPWLYEDEEGTTWVTYGQRPKRFMWTALQQSLGDIEDIFRGYFK